MNIIHLLSQNQLTGAEVYAVTLAQNQIESGHQVYQLSNDFFFPTTAVKFKLEVETKSFRSFFKNVLWLRNFIRKQNIQVVHSHSRAAVKLAYWSLLFSKTAQVSTVHGIQHSSLSKKIHNQYGEFIIAVCENIKNHLISDFSYRSDLIKIIPNPVSSETYHYVDKIKASKKNTKLAIVGRTTGPKGERTSQVLNALNPAHFEISLIGGSVEDLSIGLELKKQIKEIKTVGLSSAIYSDYDLVIGSGRVCIESLITGVPTIAFGEAHYVGLITESNFHEALSSNFGDIHPSSKAPNLNAEKFKQDLENSETQIKNPEALSKLAIEQFSLISISAQVMRLYESAFFLKNYSSWVPVLMYHKIPLTPLNSVHKIFVTRDNLERHLSFFKGRGFETLTFSDLQQFRTGERDFKYFPKKPLVLTFDDGYSDNLENAAPLLQKYNFKAQVFLLADKSIDQNQWDQNSGEASQAIISGQGRKAWKESPFEVGSHGFCHKKITELSEVEALSELKQSKQLLESEFGVSVNVFAFTFGVSSVLAAKLAEKAGYAYALNTDTGGMLIEEDPYNIFRVSIFPNENTWSLFKKTSSWYRKYYKFKRKK